MKTETDPAELVLDDALDAIARTPAVASGAVTARLHGFDLDERPRLVGLPGLCHEIVAARTTVRLTKEHVGATVVAVYEDGDVRRPIILGVLVELPLSDASHEPAPAARLVSLRVDDDELLLSAARQIVLKCGDASITLTRAGKIIINGRYLLSRSSGYNKIKGAAVDIN